jgi:cytochrome b6
MSVPISVEQDAKKKNQKIPAKPMFPHLIWHDMINCLILLGVLATLSILIPSDLGHEIDYLKPAPAGVKPDWFFLWVYQTLKILPTYVLGIEGETVGIVGLAFISIFVAFIPFLDIKSQRNELSPYFTLAGIACMCVFIICTAIGYFF